MHLSKSVNSLNIPCRVIARTSRQRLSTWNEVALHPSRPSSRHCKAAFVLPTTLNYMRLGWVWIRLRAWTRLWSCYCLSHVCKVILSQANTTYLLVDKQCGTFFVTGIRHRVIGLSQNADVVGSGLTVWCWIITYSILGVALAHGH